MHSSGEHDTIHLGMKISLLLREGPCSANTSQGTLEVTLPNLSCGEHFEGMGKYPLELVTLGLLDFAIGNGPGFLVPRGESKGRAVGLQEAGANQRIICLTDQV